MCFAQSWLIGFLESNREAVLLLYTREGSSICDSPKLRSNCHNHMTCQAVLDDNMYLASIVERAVVGGHLDLQATTPPKTLNT